IKSFNPKSLTDFLKFSSSGNLNLWVLNGEVEIAFTVTDKFLSLGLYTDNGVYDASKDLISEDPRAILWGNKLFKYYREKSDKIELKRLYKILSHLIK
ncbi:MAG TPA: transcriptional regulator FilR1 domain-containing protein, partial [Methanobacterium sp.]|nr:transcriptional regulator FilR1 domain-containing protein [Methanobacterium sp.]